MTTLRRHIAHQLGPEQDGWLRARLPAGTRVDRLPEHDPWAVPSGITALLVANGKLRSLSRARPAWAADLNWVHMRPTGVDEAPDWLFDIPHVTVSRGASATAIAEYVLATMLDFEKRLADLRMTSPQGWKPVSMGGLAGRNLGLFGFGGIGQAVASRALAFGMHVRATRRHPGPIGLDNVETVSLDELCAQSDHLVLCAPLTPETSGLFDTTTFAWCKAGQHLVNVARGALIVPEALRAALDGPVARASLDVWTEEPPPKDHWVYSHPQIVLTPHCSSRGPSTEVRLQEILETNLTFWLEDRSSEMQGRVLGVDRY